MDALMDTLVDPHETKARRDAAADSLRRAGASATAARHVADAELASARSETRRRLAETEKGAGFALEACEATFRALRAAFVHDAEGAEGAEVPRVPRSSRSGVPRRDLATLAPRRRRSLGRWERAASLPEACAAVLACVRHVDAFVADAPTRVAEGLLETTQTHPGINGAMKRVLAAATEGVHRGRRRDGRGGEQRGLDRRGREVAGDARVGGPQDAVRVGRRGLRLGG